MKVADAPEDAGKPAPVLLPVPTPGPGSSEGCLIDAIHFASGWLTVIGSSAHAGDVHILFKQVHGFRMLDAVDLGEFCPPTCPTTDFFFEVKSGGWKALEQSRPGFFSGQAAWVREFLILGRDECLSVLSKEAPVLSSQTIA